MSRLEFNPLISLPLWLTLAAAAVALWSLYAVSARRRLVRGRWLAIVALMGVALALPLSVLLNPTWVERIPPPAGKPLLTVALDTSASMSTTDVPADSSPDGALPSAGAPPQVRLAAGRTLARRIQDRLKDEFDVRFMTFAAGTRPCSIQELERVEPAGDSTDLAGSVDELLSEDRAAGQAIVVLGDAAHNAGPAAALRQTAARAKAANTPIYGVTLGGAAGVSDLEVALAASQELAFVGQKVPVHVRVKQRGMLINKAHVTLWLNDKQVDESTVDVGADGEASTSFQAARDQVGLYRYEVRVDADPHEVTPLNNVASLLLRVVDQPVRVLLLEGKPYWDTKFLLRTLAADPSIALSSVVRIAEGRLLEREISVPMGAAAVPPDKKAGSDPDPDKKAAGSDPDPDKKDAARAERWEITTDAGKWLANRAQLAKYQVIILGRDAEVFLSDEALAQLKKWLADGDGSLVCFRGAPATQLSQRVAGLMPVKWTPTKESRFRVKLTASGQELRWLPLDSGDDDPLSHLPSLATVNAVEARPIMATVLAASATQPATETPVIAYQAVGLGKVVAVEGAGMWRWAFLPHPKEHEDELYGLLWRSLVRWLTANAGLSPSQSVALRTDYATFHANEPVTATLLLRESQLQGDVPKIELSPEQSATTPDPSWPRSITPVPNSEYAGQFRVPFGSLPEGHYQAKVVGTGDDPSARIVFDVRGNLAERLDVAARPDLMRLLCDDSGGAVLKGDVTAELTKQLQEHLSRSHPERILRTPAWDRWWVLAAVLGLWGLCWIVRRRSGLV